MESFLNTLQSFADDNFERFIEYDEITREAIMDIEDMVQTEDPDLTLYPEDKTATKLPQQGKLFNIISIFFFRQWQMLVTDWNRCKIYSKFITNPFFIPGSQPILIWMLKHCVCLLSYIPYHPVNFKFCFDQMQRR